MNAEQSYTVDFPSDREIRAIRRLRAPRELVFRAWTEPEHLTQWWGPRGFTMTVAELDVRPGGRWEFTFHGPDGVDYLNQLAFLEIEAPSRLVLRHENAPRFTITATFAESAGTTTVTFSALFDSAEVCAGVKSYAVPGNRETLDRLEERVALLLAGKAWQTTRLLDAPVELVWKAWTELPHLMAWFGPQGFTVSEAKLELVPGGEFHYGITSPEGLTMWGRWRFREIVPRKKLVLLSSFSDAQRGVTRHPLSSTWPLETLSTTLLEPVGDKTLMTIEWLPFYASAQELQTFLGAFESMNQGWGGTLAKLEAYLAEQRH